MPRPRAIRAKVVCLLIVPIVSLMTLWGLAAVQAAQTVYTLTQLQQLNAAIHLPTDNLVDSLQRERTGVAQQLAAQGDPGQVTAALSALYASTDNAAAALRSGAGTSAAAATGLGADVSSRISTLL
ncbi:MAG: nitrate- and nitrite sensing domain-containing protein, partial [Actinocrinis sp.]